MPKKLDKYDPKVFFHCRGLKEIELSEGIVALYDDFFWCRSLEKVVLPKSLKAICGYSFSGSPSLREIEIPETVATIDSNAFTSIREDLCIKGRRGSAAERLACCRGLTFIQT